MNMPLTELEKRKEEEYEMQLFGFHSRAVNATLKNIINDTIESKCKKLCQTLEKAYKPEAEQLEILKTNERQLIKMYCSAAVPHYKVIKNVVNKYIAVPHNVLLEEDKSQRIQYTEKEFEAMQEKLKALQEKAKRVNILNTLLKEEVEMLEQFQVSKSKIISMCNIIERGSTCSNTNNKMQECISKYRSLDEILPASVPISQKEKYNPQEDIRLKSFNPNSL